MKSVSTMTAIFLLALGLLAIPGRSAAQDYPKALRGQVITSDHPIQVPDKAADFIKNIKKQDKAAFRRNSEGKWVIHFVAFFKYALPGQQMGVVVLDGKNEPVAVAEVGGTKGQRSLASRITVETTESPGKSHVLQVYYPKGGKPVVLARKTITLK